MHALALYRVSNRASRLRIPLVPMLLSRIPQTFCAVEIDYRARLGPGIALFHCFGIVIGSEPRIGSRCRIYHAVALGTRGRAGNPRLRVEPAVASGAGPRHGTATSLLATWYSSPG